jgi:hypothetical protein
VAIPDFLANQRETSGEHSTIPSTAFRSTLKSTDISAASPEEELAAFDFDNSYCDRYEVTFSLG